MTVHRLFVSAAVVAATFVPHAVAAQTVAPTPAPQPSLFPGESRIAFVDLTQVASNSVPGKELFAKLKAFRDGKLFELGEKQKQLDGMQAQLASAGILNEAARSQLAKNIERTKREIQFGSEDAQAQFDELQQDGLTDLRKRISPILKDIASERHLDAIFSMAETAPAFVDPRIDLSAEVTKRLDASVAKK
jgi:Skp family chaperone for outer membrane proteins